MQTAYLQHYGVKGMRWGIRRYQNPDGSLTAKGKQRYATKGFSEDAYNENRTKLGKAWDLYTDAHKYAGQSRYHDATDAEREARAKKYVTDHKIGEKSSKPKVSDMSDQELQQKINRMLKEKQYKDMTKSPYRKAGETIVTGIVIAAGTELAKEYAKKYMRQGLEAVLNASQ